jgi:hypothetical protein
MPFGASFGAMHQIAFADDANQLALIVYDGRSADPPLQKDLSHLFYRRRRLHGNHREHHHVARFHR